jgi:hypothetical protein
VEIFKANIAKMVREEKRKGADVEKLVSEVLPHMYDGIDSEVANEVLASCLADYRQLGQSGGKPNTNYKVFTRPDQSSKSERMD